MSLPWRILDFAAYILILAKLPWCTWAVDFLYAKELKETCYLRYGTAVDTKREQAQSERSSPPVPSPTTVLPLRALWPSLGHQMTPVVASPGAKASRPHPVVRCHLIFHRNTRGRKYPRGSTDAEESHKMAPSWAAHVASAIVNFQASKHTTHNTTPCSPALWGERPRRNLPTRGLSWWK